MSTNSEVCRHTKPARESTIAWTSLHNPNIAKQHFVPSVLTKIRLNLIRPPSLYFRPTCSRSNRLEDVWSCFKNCRLWFTELLITYVSLAHICGILKLLKYPPMKHWFKYLEIRPSKDNIQTCSLAYPGRHIRANEDSPLSWIGNRKVRIVKDDNLSSIV